jgi:hypothetical protein
MALLHIEAKESHGGRGSVRNVLSHFGGTHKGGGEMINEILIGVFKLLWVIIPFNALMIGAWFYERKK